MNMKDGKAMSIPMWVIYTDEKSDFAVLGINFKKIDEKVINNLVFEVMPPSACKETKDFKEGEKVLYIGYPLSMGINEKNYPLSRLGIVSQLIPTSNIFLIDGFVQHGHSGSPVFTFQFSEATSTWNIYLVGIATSFPNEYGNVYKKVRYKLTTELNTELNPGFTYVMSMNLIIPIINKILTME